MQRQQLIQRVIFSKLAILSSSILLVVALMTSLQLFQHMSIFLDTLPVNALVNKQLQDAVSVSSFSGSYTGTIAIDKPLALGILDISLAITDTNGSLSGRLDNSGSLAFPSAAALSGSITGKVNGITPTFRIDAVPFSSIVSGRNVTRSFRLDGTVEENGNVIRGIYTETIKGFTPSALIVNGLFLASRAAPAIASGVPEATPTSTPVSNGGRIYLPVISNQKRTAADGMEQQEVNPTSEATPTPISTPVPDAVDNEQTGASEQQPEATEGSGQNIYLPSVVNE